MSEPLHKMLLYNYEGNINQISSGNTSLKNVLMISEGIALKRKKVGPTVLNFFLYPFLPPVKQHETAGNSLDVQILPGQLFLDTF